MNAFLTLLVLTLFVCAGVALLIPALTVAAALAVMFACFLLWLLPILLIADSSKTTGGEKLAWILAIIFLSWFAWIFYFLLAPLKPKPRYYY